MIASALERMTRVEDKPLLALVAGVLALLLCASGAGWTLGRRVTSASGRATVDNINARIRAWWVIALLFIMAVTTGRLVSILLFALTSLLALREFMALVPAKPGDRRALAYSFFVVTSLQYVLIWFQWDGLFSILIPVYVSMFLAIRAALAGDTDRFLERTATNQWGLMICVYFLSYVPALLMLRIGGYEQHGPHLMFFLVIVVELGDVFQYVWGKTLGRRRVAPSISPNKTWEGLVGGVVCASALGAGIWWATPFSPAAAGLMALVLTTTGFAGGLIMSAIKRDRGVKDYGTLIGGHGGVLDRIDSLCFAAPIFFHLTRHFYTP
jgi:phosphatidate cytidylyltransferase